MMTLKDPQKNPLVMFSSYTTIIQLYTKYSNHLKHQCKMKKQLMNSTKHVNTKQLQITVTTADIKLIRNS